MLANDLVRWSGRGTRVLESAALRVAWVAAFGAVGWGRRSGGWCGLGARSRREWCSQNLRKPGPGTRVR